MSCLAGLRYGFKADIYVQEKTQSPSGAIGREYVFDRTIDCLVESIHTDSTTDEGSGKKMRQQYREYDVALIYCAEQLSKRMIIANIRTPDGEIFWKDDAGNSIAFDVQGAKPVTNFSNRVLEYETLCYRSEVQDVYNR